MSEMGTIRKGAYFRSACKESVYASFFARVVQGSEKIRCFHNLPCGHSMSPYKTDLQIMCMIYYITLHGDIRAENIVYGNNTGTIIDFDFAAPEGNVYPMYYSPLAGQRPAGAYV